MLDPFTSLSVASAIVQFVDFGSKLVIEGYGVYKSAEGAPQGEIDTQELVKDLEILCGRLATSSPAHATQYSPSEKQLQAVALKCQELSKGLFELLEALKVTSQGLTRGWDSLRLGVKRAWKTDKIEKLQKQLSDVRTQVNTHVLATLRDLTKRNELLHMQTETQLTEMRSCLLTAVQDQERALNGLKTANNQSSAANAQALASYEGTLNNLSLQLDTLIKRGDSIATSQKILESLMFAEMHRRHNAIAAAHEQTFEWIFQGKDTTFKTWLSSGSGIFWVNGKAGSGKSTLMKFLSDHRKSESILSEWAKADKKSIVCASFYFWNSGLPMEKTQEGLLQSLLFQILRKCPAIIPDLFPDRWNADELSHRYAEPWTRVELSSALTRIMELPESQMSARFCFFIDGLDEYEGDHHQLVVDLKTLSRSTSVKLCVSSRPWTEFQDAFGNDDNRMLILQDLTRGDMDRFVRDVLQKDERFVRMAKTERNVQNFIEEVLDKAQGVFLWVFLVVRSLLRGSGQHDDITILEKRLRELPPDLGKYFKHIFDSIEDVYQDHAARMFQLMVRAAPLPLTAFWYLPREMENPNYVLESLTMAPITDAEAEEHKIKAEYSINAWCRDLLEVRTERHEVAFLRHKVDFSHRTVKDFLLTKDIQKLLDARINSEFSPCLSLLRVHLFEAKSLPNGNDGFFKMRHFEDVARAFMHSAQACEIHTGASPLTLIDELERVGIHVYEMAKTQGGPMTHDFFGATKWWYESFMTYAMYYGLTLYIRQTFAQAPRKAGLPEPTRLLDFALNGLMSMPSLAMVQALLDSGADPNHDSRLDKVDRRSPISGDDCISWKGHHNNTPWEGLLNKCYCRQKIWPVARLLLLKGADTNARVNVAIKSDVKSRDPVDNDPYADARECLVRCCPPEHLDELDQLLRDATDQLTPNASKDVDGSVWSRFVNACWEKIYGR